MSDVWSAVHPFPSNAEVLTQQEEVDLLGVSCDSKLNCFTPHNLEATANDPNAKRIDYIFTTETTVHSTQVTLTDRIPDRNINYSDHFAVTSTFHLPDKLFPKRGYIPPSTFNSIHEITLSYINREEKHAMIRIVHFYLSLVFCTSMFIAVWFVDQKRIIFIMMFCSALWCSYGVLDWVIGFVWGTSELRTLREFMNEMELARKVYAGEVLLE